MANYPNCKLTFHDIANIHAMRDSLSKLMDACHSSYNNTSVSSSSSSHPSRSSTANSSKAVDSNELKWFSNIDSSAWYHHISKIMKAASKIVELIDKKAVSVLVHCSDGWDRTPQLVGGSKLVFTYPCIIQPVLTTQFVHRRLWRVCV